MNHPIIFLLAGLLGTAQAAGQESAWPRETRYDGPRTFCAVNFAIDLASDESVIVRDPGLDFLVTTFVAGDGSLSIYEGNAPSAGASKRRPPFKLPFRAKMLADDTGFHGYLVRLGRGDGFETYLHIFGGSLDGTKVDRSRLSRIQIGDPEKTGCGTLTYHMDAIE